MDVYLIVLEGQGDINVKVVDKATFDWLEGPDGRPEDDATMWEDPFVPPVQRDLMGPLRAEYDEGPLQITSGSWDNDRAMAAVGIPPYKAYYTTVRGAMAAINKRGDKVVDEYHGCIY